MKVLIAFGRLSFKISFEALWKPIKVKSYFRVVNGRRIHVREHLRK